MNENAKSFIDSIRSWLKTLIHFFVKIEVRSLLFIAFVFSFILILRYIIKTCQKVAKCTTSKIGYESLKNEEHQHHTTFQRRFIVLNVIAFTCELLNCATLWIPSFPIVTLLSVPLNSIPFVSLIISCIILAPLIEYFAIFPYQSLAILLSYILHGISSWCLFSTFETWMLYHHKLRKLNAHLLQHTYQKLAISIFMCILLIGQCAYITQETNLNQQIIKNTMFNEKSMTTITTPPQLLIAFGEMMSIIGLLLSIVFFWLSPIGNINYIYNDWYPDDENNKIYILHNTISSSSFKQRIISSILYVLTRFQMLSVGVSHAFYDSSLWIFSLFWNNPLAELNTTYVFYSMGLISILGAYISTIVGDASDIIDPRLSSQYSLGSFLPLFDGTTVQPGEKNVHCERSRLIQSENDDKLLYIQTLNSKNSLSSSSLKNNHNNSVWHSSIEVQPTSIHNDIVKGIFFPNNLRLPLRVLIIISQLLTAGSLICILHTHNLELKLYSVLAVSFCMGIHYTAGLNLRAQIISDKGRIIAYSLFNLVTAGINLGNTQGMLVHNWTFEKCISLASNLSIFGAILSAVSLFVHLTRRPVPPWHSSHIGIVYDDNDDERDHLRIHNAYNPEIVFFEPS